MESVQCKTKTLSLTDQSNLYSADENRKYNEIKNETVVENGLEKSASIKNINNSSIDYEVVEMFRELSDKTIETVKITYKVYESELELPNIMKVNIYNII